MEKTSPGDAPKKKRVNPHRHVPAPAPKEMVIKNAFWAILAVDGSPRQYFINRIFQGGGIVRDPNYKTQFLVYGPNACWKNYWKEAKQREQEGTLFLVPEHIFSIWSSPNLERDFASLDTYSKIWVAMFCMEHPGAFGPVGTCLPEKWLGEHGADYLNSLRSELHYLYTNWVTKPCNRASLEHLADEKISIPSLCRVWAAYAAIEDGWRSEVFEMKAIKKHALMLIDLLRQDEYHAMCVLFSVLKEWEEERKESSYTDGAYTRTLFMQYMERIMATGDSKVISEWLEYKNKLFPGELSDEAAAVQNEYALGLRERPPIYLQAGTTFAFGRYPQTAEGGVLPIEWNVLVQKDGKLLLLSRNGLALKKYHETDEDVTWDACTLRAWLNGAFLQEAFSPEEQQRIEPTHLTPDANPQHWTPPGKDTDDKVFLPGYDMVGEYLHSYIERTALPSAYLVAIGKDLDVRETGQCWWLRTPGYKSNLALYISREGEPVDQGNPVTCPNCCVRPAIWIRIPE